MFLAQSNFGHKTKNWIYTTADLYIWFSSINHVLVGCMGVNNLNKTFIANMGTIKLAGKECKQLKWISYQKQCFLWHCLSTISNRLTVWIITLYNNIVGSFLFSRRCKFQFKYIFSKLFVKLGMFKLGIVNYWNSLKKNIEIWKFAFLQ